MFATSPFYEGKPFGGKSYRAKVWLDTDNDRSGLVPTVWKKGAKYFSRRPLETGEEIPAATVNVSIPDPHTDPAHFQD